MKHFAEMNYYDLLEIPPTATPDQIQKAYEIAKKTYGKESIATYSLFDDTFRSQILGRIEEAFAILMDGEQRNQYDLKLGLRPPVSEPAKMPDAIGTSEPLQTTLSAGPSDQVQEISGEFLKQCREQMGIPLQEIATETRINITYLQFIEQDHFQGLPPEVYLRGYLVQYARMLKLNPDHIAEQYLSLYHNWKKSRD